MTLKIRIRNLADGSVRDLETPIDAPASIGRGDDAAIQLEGSEISRVHAVIERAGERLFVTAQGRNGAHRNGAILAAGRRTPVEPGDVIGIPGYELEIAPAAAAPGEAVMPLKRSMLAPISNFWSSFTFSEKLTTAVALISLGVVAVYLTS